MTSASISSRSSRPGKAKSAQRARSGVNEVLETVPSPGSSDSTGRRRSDAQNNFGTRNKEKGVKMEVLSKRKADESPAQKGERRTSTVLPMLGRSLGAQSARVAPLGMGGGGEGE